MRAEIKTYIQSHCPKGIRLAKDKYLLVDASKQFMVNGKLENKRITKTVNLGINLTDTLGDAKEKFEDALAEAIQLKKSTHYELATKGVNVQLKQRGVGQLTNTFNAMFNAKWGTKADTKQAMHVKDYFKDIEEYFQPDFKLNAFTEENISLFREWVANKIVTRPSNFMGSVSNNSINKRLGVIREILRYAIRKRILDAKDVPNPDPRVKNMGVVDLPRGDSKQKPAFTIEEQERFIKMARDCNDDEFADCITVGFDLGMRHDGELFGFTVDDINFGRKTIQFYRPKTGVRSEEMPLNGRLQNIFIKYRQVAMQRADRKMFPFSKSKMRWKWDKYIKLCGYKSTFTPYCTRHTYVTRLAEAGVNPKVVQKLAGHKAIETTLKYYTKTSSKLLADAMKALENQVTEYEEKIEDISEKLEENSMIGHNSKGKKNLK